jgi:class 3 adenylate cyclase
MAETREPAAILAADVVGYRRTSRAVWLMSALPPKSGHPSDS